MLEGEDAERVRTPYLTMLQAQRQAGVVAAKKHVLQRQYDQQMGALEQEGEAGVLAAISAEESYAATVRAELVRLKLPTEFDWHFNPDTLTFFVPPTGQ